MGEDWRPTPTMMRDKRGLSEIAVTVALAAKAMNARTPSVVCRNPVVK
jgi:hypothetical protein